MRRKKIMLNVKHKMLKNVLPHNLIYKFLDALHNVVNVLDKLLRRNTKRIFKKCNEYDLISRTDYKAKKVFLV